MRYCHLQQGQKCPNCNNDNIRLSYDYVKEQIESVEGYKLLSPTYKNSRSKIKVQCSKGHIYNVTYGNFYMGYRCPYCAGIKCHIYDYVKEQIESVEGYKLLSPTYKNSKTKLKIRCGKGHEYEVVYGSFHSGRRCPYCNKFKGTSKAEKEIDEMVKEFLPNENIIENDRTQIINPRTGHNLELDVWIPSLKKAIEYNGIYWHSGNLTKEKDKEKIKQCKEKGIELLIIEEEDWYSNKNNCIELLKDFIND